jgi:UDP-sugar transporter A1/2/3
MTRTQVLHALLILFFSSFQGWTLQSSLIAAGLPAAIYAVQGVLYVFSYQNLDSVTFNGLSQTKTLSAALCCYIILGQKQSAVQISALVLLALSALIFQGTFAKIIQQWSAQSPSISAEEKQMQKSRFTLGIVPCLAASFLSGLAGAFSQKGLQQTGGAGRNAYLYTMEVSGISAICITFSIIFDRIKERIKINGYDKDQKEKNGTQNNFFDYWTLSTMYPIVLKAFGGVLTALVHKNAGSVAKGFALICGLVLSGIIQTMIDKESLSVDQIVGIILVNVSSWLHFSTPKIV